MEPSTPGGFGVDPHGVPWPVHAPVARDYGVGAFVGLARGVGLSSPLVGLIGVVVDSLMRRGMWRPDQVLPRVAEAAVQADALPLLALPIALFHADDPEARRAAIYSLGAALGASDDQCLTALAVASAVAAGTFELADAEAMVVAMVLTIDAQAETAPDAHVRIRNTLRDAVAAASLEALDDPLARAVFHLLRDTDGAHLVHEPPAIRALAGLLVGAALGLDAWPDATDTVNDPLLAPLLRILPDLPTSDA